MLQMNANGQPLRMLTIKKHDAEERQRPLEFRLIARLMEFTKPYARKRN
jgi:hypothetical protein